MIIDDHLLLVNSFGPTNCKKNPALDLPPAEQDTFAGWKWHVFPSGEALQMRGKQLK
ncbi:hypothetical protein [Marinovum algicola]|uniref:hypothetical protein n=1 Tax=Marinovum algicola TaxID=42444 RepID=UPI00147DC86B|nr:hypothetical protein [Marinovum algicola]